MNIFRFTERQIRNVGFLFLSLYLVIAVFLYRKTGAYISTDDYKYPPQIYYTSYALGISFILYVYRSKIVYLLKAIRLQKFASFVGSHTLWIYFWHIPIVEYMAEHFNTITTFVTVYFLSIFVTYLQSFLVNKICGGINNQKLCKHLQMIFIG
jgi:peptidoglycan/LPS O-acetylase OafA/YrhL